MTKKHNGSPLLPEWTNNIAMWFMFLSLVGSSVWIKIELGTYSPDSGGVNSAQSQANP
jgi:hypothetical protein